jgi:hypothetical protein
VLVVGEIRQGIERLARRDDVQVKLLERWLGQLVDVYDDRIGPVSVDVAVVWGCLNVPNQVPVVDGRLAPYRAGPRVDPGHAERR